MTLVTEVREINEQAKQTRAVAAHLEDRGVISNHEAIYQGVPGYGVITRLGARIADLRDAGYEIRTEDARSRPDRNTHYWLVSVPKPMQKALHL